MRKKQVLRAAAATATSAVVAVGTLVLAPTKSAIAGAGGLSDARSGTAAFHNLEKATSAGYGLLADKDGIECIDKEGVGAMGVHYAKGSLVEDAAVVAGTPEVLVYEPQRNGNLRLVGVEYVVLKQAWHDAGNAAAPSLFGKRFEEVAAGNRYGLPDFYALHASIWRDNPSGMFAPWNPRVSCMHA